MKRWQGHVQAGLLSREITSPGCRRCLQKPEGNIRQRRYRELPGDPARSETLCMYGTSMRENREVPRSPVRPVSRAGRSGNAEAVSPEMNERGKSDNLVVPANPPNKAGRPACGGGGGKESGRGEHGQSKHVPDAVPGKACQVGWTVCGKLHVRDKDARFTALLHHVDAGSAVGGLRGPQPEGGAGCGRVTWEAYGQDLRANLEDLHGRVQSGPTGRARLGGCTYRSRTGGMRPLGIATVTA